MKASSSGPDFEAIQIWIVKVLVFGHASLFIRLDVNGLSHGIILDVNVVIVLVLGPVVQSLPWSFLADSHEHVISQS